MGVLRKAMAVLRSLGQAERAVAGAFVDVGANIGTAIVTAMREHGFAGGVACEPEPHNHTLLSLNLLANGLQREVRALPVAVSNEGGEVELLVGERKSGSHELRSDGTAKQGDRTIRVERLTLDFLVERSILKDDGTGMIWIDAQGHEGQVLAGANRLLANGIPVVFEFYPSMVGRHGGLELLEQAVTRNYTHVLNVRRVRGFDDAGDASAVNFDPVPVERFGAVVDEVRAARGTDLMLIRES
jgi:FkbM family methyltransferase